MSYAFGSTGLTIQTLAEIIDDYKALAREVFGARVNLTSSSPLYNLLAALAEREYAAQLRNQEVYASFSPNGASGVVLDDRVGLVGVTRLAATASRVLLTLFGTSGTVIPAGSKVRIPSTTSVFETDDEVIIGDDYGCRLVLSGELITDNTFTATVNGGAVSVPFNTDHETTMADLATAIDAAPDTASAVVVDDGVGLSIEVTGLTAVPTVTSPTITGGASQATVASYAVVNAYAEALETGPTPVDAGTLTEIVTPVGGWTLVTNDIDGTEGRDEETDAALRIRRDESLQNIGAGTVPAIRSRVNEIAGVINCSVEENATDATVDGRPPHSLEIIVDVGTSPSAELLQEIADLIFEIKPGGIQLVSTSGVSVTKTVTDDEGNNWSITFSRPGVDDVYVDISVTTDANYPADGDDQLMAAVKAAGDALGVGEDVLLWKLEAACVDVPGVLTLVITAKVGSAPAGGDTANITVAANRRASFALANMTVT